MVFFLLYVLQNYFYLDKNLHIIPYKQLN